MELIDIPVPDGTAGSGADAGLGHTMHGSGEKPIGAGCSQPAVENGANASDGSAALAASYWERRSAWSAVLSHGNGASVLASAR